MGKDTRLYFSTYDDIFSNKMDIIPTGIMTCVRHQSPALLCIWNRNFLKIILVIIKKLIRQRSARPLKCVIAEKWGKRKPSETSQ